MKGAIAVRDTLNINHWSSRVRTTWTQRNRVGDWDKSVFKDNPNLNKRSWRRGQPKSKIKEMWAQQPESKQKKLEAGTSLIKTKRVGDGDNLNPKISS
jgi:hypothetical protein